MGGEALTLRREVRQQVQDLEAYLRAYRTAAAAAPAADVNAALAVPLGEG